jgi:hypothetical protein
MGALRERRKVRGPRGTWELFASEADGGHWLEDLRHQPHTAAVYIQAVNASAPDERLLWTTTDDSAERVLDEIEDGLAEGHVVQPLGAVYSGAQRTGSRLNVEGFVYPDVPVEALDVVRCAAMDAYELVDQVPGGPVRGAAWNAYALQTYGDELLLAGRRDFVASDTAEMAGRLFSQACIWLERALGAGEDLHALQVDATHDELPDWLTPTRSHAQIAGMRETLETLRVWVAAELARQPELVRLHERLAGIEARLENVSLLWIERPPAELRRGIGATLNLGLDEAYELGQDVAVLA